VITAERPSAAFQAIEGRPIGLALIDIKLPEYDGLEFIRRLKENRPEIETIVMSGHGDMESVIAAFRLGAFDYLKKPFTTIELQAALSRTTRYLVAVDESRRYAGICAELNKELAADGDFIGESSAMVSVREQIAVAAANPDTPVLIQGESGTGKELVARRIHALSARVSGRFVAVNCAAVPKDIFESEFFGHERGAFTDARQMREGLFRTAHGGSLFLDEIGETPIELQSKLLRAIEEKKVRPIGSDEERESDARIICASNRNLLNQTAQGTFRKDLYYRLAVVEIHLKPLRERSEDIPVLARHFLALGKLHPVSINEILDASFLQAMMDYNFPGNIRELRNIMERTCILGRKPTNAEIANWFNMSGSNHLTKKDIPVRDVENGQDRTCNLKTMEAQLIDQALHQANGVHAQAARLLGISRQALDRKLKKSF